MEAIDLIDLQAEQDWDDAETVVMPRTITARDRIRRAPTAPEFLELPPEHWANRLAKSLSPSFNEVDDASIPKTVL